MAEHKLLRKILSHGSPDYSTLVSSITTVQTLIEYADGVIVKNAAYDILVKLFLSGTSNECGQTKPVAWFHVVERKHSMKFYSVFDDRQIYYYNDKCDMLSKPYEPIITYGIDRAIRKIGDKLNSYSKHVPMRSFRDIADGICLYIGYGLLHDITFEDMQLMLGALHELLEQRIYFDKALKSNMVEV
jgi:hypothetical protein